MELELVWIVRVAQILLEVVIYYFNFRIAFRKLEATLSNEMID
jgi:hypothetical protein